ncbi:uncharacterized protein LY79DRAFT_572659 [Colletotrichum navitas]|uniref:Uncharacterized protein n=1 Tax=Colletotrichum navitas TaxID=681940 RepID=A0AAD8UXS9_9PEZI|nr:uncharacterized protein LY79DRAFT_572659 [Colletotrichum navitas]KAK1566119.1 hypothetical protein LY79DRAFT_572659 [Colletotrichum navitas]
MKITAFVALISLISQGALTVAAPQQSVERSLERRNRWECRCTSNGGMHDVQDTEDTCALRGIKGTWFKQNKMCYLDTAEQVRNFQSRCNYRSACRFV